MTETTRLHDRPKWALPILSVRSMPPALEDWEVDRRDLVARLTGVGAPRVVSVTAAAGYGKTVLLTQLVKASPCVAAWISLDTRDNNPRQLLGQLLVAFEFAGVLDANVVADALDRLTKDVDSVWACLINGIRRFAQPVRLYVDNLERLSSGSSRELLQRLLEQAPANLSFALSGRGQPQPGMSRWRLRGELATVDERQLAMSAEETGALCASTSLSLSDTFKLEAATGGWPAAIRLWLAAWQDSPGFSGGSSLFDPTVAEKAQTYLAEYLKDEVLGRLPDKLTQFLQDTCVVDSFNVDLAGLLAHSNDVVRILGRLRRHHLFVYPEAHKANWFRYHPLFRKALLNDREAGDPVGTKALQKQAGDWLLEHGHFGEGLYQYARNQSVSLLLSVVEKHTFDLLREGQVNEIVSSLARIPRQVGHDHFALAITEASVAHVSRDVNRIKASIRSLAPLLRKAPPHADLRRVGQAVTYLRSQIAYLGGNPRHGIRLCDTALAELDPVVPSHAAESVIRFHRANCHHALGHLKRAYGDASRALNDLKRNGLTGYVNTLGLLLGQIDLQQGRISDAEQRFDAMVVARTDARATSSNFYDVYCYLGMGMVRREQNQLAAAESFLNQAAAIALEFEPSAALSWAFHQLALVAWAKGDGDRASEIWQECQRLAWAHQHYGIYRLAGAYRVRLVLYQGNDDDYVNQWREEWRRTESCYGADTFPEERMALAWWRFRHGDMEGADRACHALLDQFADEGQVDLTIDAWLLKSCMLREQGHLDRAVWALNQAIVAADDHQLPILFFREGRDLVELVRQALSRRSSEQLGLSESLARREFVEQVLAKRHEPGGRAPLPEGDLLPFEPLTRREHDVLKLVAQGKSNQDVANTLFVGLSTVKTHINSIFRKLEVSTREEACAKASQFHLIG